jgi:hypothetical protein
MKHESIWLKVKHPFGNEEYIPKLVNVTAKDLQQ